jgi:hypothetical protein
VIDDQQFETAWSGCRAELERDVVGIWMLVGAVERAIPGLSDEEVRDRVLDVIERAVRAGEAEAATYDNASGAYKAWSESPSEVRERVRREWVALGRTPHPGEILWLQRSGGYAAPSPEALALHRARIDHLRERLRTEKPWRSWWAECGRAELAELLWSRWDPVGFESPQGGFKPPRDEYARYADELEKLLRSGATANDVDDVLRDVVVRRMRLDPDLDTVPIGHDVIDWYTRAVAALGD